MSTLRQIFREVIGLFVDDGSLALAIIAVVLFAATVAAIAPDDPLAAGGVLVLGCLGVLATNISRGARRS
jgi:hypothetical protein